MIEYSDALQRILSTANTKETGEVNLPEALNHILATHVYSDVDLPPFDKSAMDGYACRKEDISADLTIIETVPAGKMPECVVGPNECTRIMTGAVIPEGADLVFMQEDAEITADNKIKCTNPRTKTNICYRGEDVRSGQQVLASGTLIQPWHLPILAGAGMTNVPVYQKPQTAVFSTGTELVEPGDKPEPHQIRNTNSAQLLGQLTNMNIYASYGGILKDNEAILEDKIQQALSGNELLILTGGVSVGTYDLIPQVLEKNGFEIIVQKTAIQPGKPMTFAVNGNKYCFGLSGNPVSSFIQFELYVKPFIYKLMGYDYRPRRFQLPLNGDVSRKNTGRLQLKPARIERNEIVPVDFHGSAHINSLAEADCLLEVPKGVSAILSGELATIRIL